MRAEWRIEPDVDWRPAAEWKRRLSRTGWERRAHLAAWVLLWVLAPWNVLAGIVASLIRPRPNWREEAVASNDTCLDALCEIPSPVRQFPVDIVVFRDGVPAGNDRGILRIIDGWLTFQGLRTEWSLSAFEARLVGNRVLPVSSLALDPATKAIRIKTDESQTYIAVCLRDETLAEHGTFVYEFEEWRSSPPWDGEAVLPPLDLHPQVRYQIAAWQARIVGRSVRGVLLILGLVRACYWFSVQGGSTAVVLPLVLGIAIPVFALAMFIEIEATTPAIRRLRSAIRVWGIAEPRSADMARSSSQNNTNIASASAKKRV